LHKRGNRLAIFVFLLPIIIIIFIIVMFFLLIVIIAIYPKAAFCLLIRLMVEVCWLVSALERRRRLLSSRCFPVKTKTKRTLILYLQKHFFGLASDGCRTQSWFTSFY